MNIGEGSGESRLLEADHNWCMANGLFKAMVCWVVLVVPWRSKDMRNNDKMTARTIGVVVVTNRSKIVTWQVFLSSLRMSGYGTASVLPNPDWFGSRFRWLTRFHFLDLQREGKALPEASLPFHRATPRMNHMALVELEKAGILKKNLLARYQCSLTKLIN